jgi:4-diphosphocytidyl-2-C-methyl-D-erythritol kinase
LQVGRFVLSKHLPVAAGVGGGSSDAAAALRLLARVNAIWLDDPRLMQAARATGADVPVCLDPRPRVMRGIGDILSEPLNLPRLPAVLVNPGVAVPTRDVFAALRGRHRQSLGSDKARPLHGPMRMRDLIDWVAESGNDLEAPAISLQPVITDVLEGLRKLPGCSLARMSGSGATCFGLFETSSAATTAAQVLHDNHPGWWVRATTLG